jgi:hypothetical protein
MSMLARLRNARAAARRARAIDKALRSAPTPAMRDEILLVAQRYER